MIVKDIRQTLRELANPILAQSAQRFFKTGEGEYGQGDKFLGIPVPVLRAHIKRYKLMLLEEALYLLKSDFHEERLFALLLIVEKFSKGDEQIRMAIYESYLRNTKYINNWDLVDSSASYIVGAYLEDKDKQPIYDLARSPSLWERRIAIISTFHLIKIQQFNHALEIAALLRNDPQDLIHKAVGWMLREIGKRDLFVEKDFLKKHYRNMPRTMLRYAIERFPERERKIYLLGKV
jgi:3-methyladenine DNA glycosylase AlkD